MSAELDRVVRELKALALALQQPLELDDVLRLTVDTAARLLGTSRASARLLDAEGAKLLAIARAGSPVHRDPDPGWKLGEGLLGWVAAERESLRSGDASEDPRYVIRADLVVPFRSFLGVPIVRGQACLGVLSAVDARPNAFGERAQSLLEMLAASCAPYIEVARLRRLSSADPLTGLLNRRGLDTLLGDESLEVLSIAMADIDHFKRVNDEHGHAVGDVVLQVVAERLAAAVRQTDAVARVGGEEFLLVLPGASLEVARRVCERARRSIRDTPIEVGGTSLPITLSFGVARRAEAESREDVTRRADEALYEAKQSGRDRVVAR